MAKIATTSLLTASLLLSGCASRTEPIKIRAVGAAAPARGSPADQIAYGRSQLALGGTGLALESFRKALRQQPDDAEALRGLGDSYAAMGRQDLARRYYEEALAMAPQDPGLLRAVGSTEVDVRAQALTPKETAQAPPSPPASSASVALVTADAPRPAATAGIKRPAPVVTKSAVVAAVAQSNPSPNLPTAPSVGSITVKLPQARPYKTASSQLPSSPRLERLSTGEVALITTGKSIWQALVAPRSLEHMLMSKSVPLRTASAAVPIRLLNAARYQGLAANTRKVLGEHGWHRLQIGNAPRVQAKSVILYPKGSESVARVLAAKLDVRKMSMARGATIVVLLGRDSVRAGARQIRA